MGHQRLGTLPATRQWNAVVALITGGADARHIAAAAATAAKVNLREASKDPALRHAFWLIARIPLAARQPDFGAALRALGLTIGNEPDLIEIGAAMSVEIDRARLKGQRSTDLAEIACKAATASLVAVASRSGGSLFGVEYAADEARAALRGLSTERQFGVLARDFIGRLTRSCLDYFLSRAIPNHVGVNKRFQSIRDHQAFGDALGLHCRETALIVEQFACEWFSKTNYESEITPAKAGGFLHVAIEKIQRELDIRSGLALA